MQEAIVLIRIDKEDYDEKSVYRVGNYCAGNICCFMQKNRIFSQNPCFLLDNAIE